VQSVFFLPSFLPPTLHYNILSISIVSWV